MNAADAEDLRESVARWLEIMLETGMISEDAADAEDLRDAVIVALTHQALTAKRAAESLTLLDEVVGDHG